MNSLKLNFRKGLIVLTLFLSCSAIAQNLQTQANQQPQKGHALYKQSKIYDSKTGAVEKDIKNVGDKALDRANYEFERTKNPYTGSVPVDIRKKEVIFSNKITKGDDLEKSIIQKSSENGKSFSYWKNRGPFNVGGRTRALAIDKTNENVILAGGVSGGLWRSENGGASWRQVTTSRQSPSITKIIQDPRPGKHNTWYYTSGERLGNSAGEGGAFYTGTGVYKSINGGRTWRLLASTDDGNIQGASPFDIVSSIAINPQNGDVYLGTFDGVYRSQDEGNSFTEVLEGGFDNLCEVAVTSSGRVYATIDNGGVPNTGFFYSDDNGENWTSITPQDLPATYGRTIIEVDPSDENTVYFLARNISTSSEAFLYKYNADNTGNPWTNLSANLPIAIGGAAGDLNLQGGYNMVLQVHPTDPELIFVGGTNLYRTFDGFSTQIARDGWVAGYSPLSSGFGLYTNQHPDQHELVFYPSNPDRVLSGNDGGVYVTENIRATNAGEPVEWISLNNGYLTTQPYHVAFDPEANSDDLVAGFQDNGTWFTNSTDPTSPWISDFGGDGAYSAIADGGLTRYVSSQRGNVYRFNFDESGTFQSFTRITPAGANGFSFVNPFILDPNNDNIMYMPVGNRIWRNNDLDEVPLFSNGAATVNWIDLPNSDTPSGTGITAVDVSKYPVANRLYYGTNSGLIYRMDNANIDSQEAIDISTGKGLPAGFVNDINVDPSNSDRVIVTFSNYGIPSLFLTEDAGETWMNISGNLEENEDGSGNGPSVRSTAFLGSSAGFGARFQRIFVATSTGLFYTNRLNGVNTRWTREFSAIGNAVADEVVTRKDGFVALAVHGNGLFSARFPINGNPLPESNLTVAYLLDDIDANENDEDLIIDITGLFVQSEGLPIAIEVVNSNPDLVTADLSGNILTISYAEDSLGQATIGLIASSGQEQVSEGFTIIVSEPSIYEQTEASVTSLPSQFFTDFASLAQSADDFTIPEGSTWNIDRILAFGGVRNSPLFTSATIVIYEDNNGLPGTEIYNSGEIAPISDVTDSNLNLQLPDIVTLESGSYWLSIYANLAFNPGGNQWFWSSQEGQIGSEPLFKDENNLFGTGAVDWTPTSIALGRPPIDQIFQIFGEVQSTDITPLDAEANNEGILTTIDSSLETIVWPNPSTGIFNINYNQLGKGKVDIAIYDIAGRVVFQKSIADTKEPIQWQAANESSGFYFVKIIAEGQNARTFKIMKK